MTRPGLCGQRGSEMRLWTERHTYDDNLNENDGEKKSASTKSRVIHMISPRHSSPAADWKWKGRISEVGLSSMIDGTARGARF